MFASHINFTSRPMIVLLGFICLLVAVSNYDISAQQSANAVSNERENGISLYQQGNDKEAIEVLRQFAKQHEDDLVVWHYLGLALAREGKTDEARKAHERAAKLGEKILDGLVEFPAPDGLGAKIKSYKPLLEDAADSADKYLTLSSKPSKSKEREWKDRAALLRDYVQLFKTDNNGNYLLKVYNPRDVTTKAHIISRTEPEYTQEARENKVSGTIVLRGIFAFDGRVRGLRIVSGLPYGLNERALAAARKIKFVPATKDGHPVSQYIQIEYNFYLF